MSAPQQTGVSQQGPSRGLVVLFAVATGQAVASNYLAQPLLETIRQHFAISAGLAGLIVTVSQVGYAAGLVLLLPLGDLFERRRLLVTLAGVNVLLLSLAGLAPSISLFMAAAGLIGFTSVMAQILVPFAAGLSPEAERGRVVGTVMSGLILGILLARTASGLIAQLAGWRAVYGVAAALMAVQMVVLARKLPTWRQHVGLSYPRLLASVPAIARAEPVLRWRAVFGALSFAAFSVLWTTLAFLLSGPHYGYGEATIGLFGLVGASGAAAATFAGRLSDRGWRDRLTGASSLLLLVGIVVLDIGAQALHITNQGEIYRLQPDARSRINAFYMVSCFVGAAAGSAGAALAYSTGGWDGVCLLGAACGLASLAWWALGLIRGPQPATARKGAAEAG